MVSLPMLLTQLGAHSIVLWVHSGRLRFTAPTGVMTPELLRILKDRRAELIEFLSSPISNGLHPNHTTARLSPHVQVLHRNTDCTSSLWWQHMGGQHACLLCHPPTHAIAIVKTNYLGSLPIIDWRNPSRDE
jgi:hypothetical protein